jgi:hypothetical protein
MTEQVWTARINHLLTVSRVMVPMCTLLTQVSGPSTSILKAAPYQSSTTSDPEVTRLVLKVIQIVEWTGMATAHIVQEQLVEKRMELPRRLPFMR